MRYNADVEHQYLEILKALGEDPERDGLRDTPKRAAAAMQFLTSGYTQKLEDMQNLVVGCRSCVGCGERWR